MPAVSAAPAPRGRQRGAVALLTVLLLSGLALLASLYAHRALLAETRGVEVQRRSAQALAAAESGLSWALAQLNAGRADAACRPGSAAADEALRDRLVDVSPTGRLAPRLDAGGAPLRAGCALEADGGWRCRCSGEGAPAAATATDGERIAFDVRVEAGPSTGLLRLVSRGCLGCGDGDLDAQAQVQQLLALVPALTGLPAAPLTARGALRLDPMAPRLSSRERDAQGLLLHAGGLVDAPALQGPQRDDPAAPANGGQTGSHASPDTALPASQVADQDAILLALPPGRFLHRYLGLEPADLSHAPAVRTLRCDGDCAAGLRAAVAAGARLLWVEGDLLLPSGLALGSPDTPVLLAVQGQARLGAGVALHGLLAASSLHWQARSGGDFIRGAVLVDGDCCEGSGAPAIERDAALLRRLAWQAGRYVPVPGSWRDYE
ncbi:hypothetical protein [Azohydromonas australica]|uniref:hypothetical protein n=1 Tax=Azohydromonas australica TaxID=364039 RepID=UPI00041C3649|nr:hypothetical protein [Azohydromonas australica]